MKALVLMAHADDETLGAGGTIQRLVKRAENVSVVILSDGIVTARGSQQNNRADADAACARLGVAPPRFLDFPDQKFDTISMSELSSRVADLNLEPDLIITHFEDDLNRDHRLTAEVAKIIGRPRKKPVTILGCEVPGTAAWNGVVFPANYYVKIVEEIETKVAAFALYRNECKEYPDPWSPQGLRVLAEYHGIQSGLGMAEAFHLVRGCDTSMLI